MRVDDKTFLYKLFATAGVLAVLVSLFLACGGDKSTEPQGPGNPVTPGVLLTGADTANAAFVTTAYFSYNAPSVLLDNTTGLLANKIYAILSPSATVSQVNALLDSLQARIINMQDTSLFMTLLIPAVSDSAQIAAICEQLRSSDLFLFAFPGHTPMMISKDVTSDPALSIVPGGPASNNISHLKKCLMPAAWNLKEHAEATPHKVPVIVSDVYGSLTPNPEIPSQRFIQIPGDAAYVLLSSNGSASGNHGFNVAGALGAVYDSTGTTGIHPGNTSLLELRSLNIGGEEWGRLLQITADSIPKNTKSILNTSLGYNDANFQFYSPLERMLYALQWRALVNSFQLMFLHATAAGNQADETNNEGSLSVYGSPFNMAAQMESEWDWIAAADLNSADSINYNSVLKFIDTTSATNIFTPLLNVLVVGSSKPNGTRSEFSNLGADVRMIGEGILGPCVIADGDCSSNFVTMNGTSQATPQIAGLAAYLMNLDANLAPFQAKEIIKNSYDNSVGVVNAYQAVLALDDGLGNAPIRKALLDVGGADGLFDETDLEVYLSVFGLMPARSLSTNPQALDYSRYDLNGDGYTGGSTRAKFDLTVDNPPAYTTITATFCGEEVSLNENSLTDEEILKYYANSSLYDGNPAERDQILECGGGSFEGVVIVTKRTDYVVASVLDHGNPFDPNDNVRVRDADSTPYIPPYDFGTFFGNTEASLTCQLDPSNTMDANASLNTSLVRSNGDTLTAITFSGSGSANNQGNFCSMNADAAADFEVQFTVVNAAVYYTLQFNGTFVKTDPSLTVETAYGYVGFEGPSGAIIDSFFTSGQTAGVNEDGQLVPGNYTLYIQGGANWNGTFDISGGLTFAPVTPTRKPAVVTTQSKK